MRIRRTDLALEAEELWRENAGQTTRLEGVEARESRKQGIPVTEVRILDGRGEKALGKPVGTYVTLELKGMSGMGAEELRRGASVLAGELKSMLDRLAPEGLVLCVGLGNRNITPDAVGPEAHSRTLVTRHLLGEAPDIFGGFRPVASLAAEVLGSTGVESCEVVRAVCREIGPACVIAVDALATRSLDRLCTTIQLADTGIAPGSGVGNRRATLNRETLGVPVIAVGVPTVVDGATLAADLTGAEDLPALGRDLFVTPRDIDRRVEELGRLVGWGVTMALQPGVGPEELEVLLG